MEVAAVAGVSVTEVIVAGVVPVPGVSVTGVMVAAILSSRVMAVGVRAWGEGECGHQVVEGEEETGVVVAMREAESLRGTQSLPLI